MKKFFNVRITALLLALCCVFGSFAAVPAYAMECDNNSENIAVCEGASVTPRAGHDILYYGQVVDILNGVAGHKITVTGTNLTPYKIVENDPRMHRVIFDLGITPLNDNVLFRVTMYSKYREPQQSGWMYLEKGGRWQVTNNPANNSSNDEWWISPGDEISFYFELSSPTDQIEIYNFALYCD